LWDHGQNAGANALKKRLRNLTARHDSRGR